MKILDKDLLKQGKVEEAILVHSYEEYQAKGGQRDMLDTYAHFKEKAKEYESRYIQMMDMDLSGIPCNREDIAYHCVYTNYWSRIQRKEYIALSMQLEDGPVTIGLARKSYRQEGIGFYLDQVYHKYDRPLTSDELKVVEDTLNGSTILDNLLEAMAYRPAGEAEEETPMPRRRRRRAVVEDITLPF